MNDSDKFFQDGPVSGTRSRPKAVNPTTGREQSWQTASNYAAPLDNPHGLITWKLRELIKGLSMRPDLARMLLTGAVIDDKDKADDIIAAAHAVAEIDAKANDGTSVHAALSRSFLRLETPEEYSSHIQAFADALRRNGLEPVATEVSLMNTALGSLGHADWIVRTADGRYLVLDVKTGSIRDARKFAVQCKVYAGADFLLPRGSNTYAPIPWRIDQTEAVLAHVDPSTGATALYRVDLVLGVYGASLAERVRDWGKINVLGPYTPAHPSIPTAGVPHPEHPTVVGSIEVTEPRPASAAAQLSAGPGVTIPAEMIGASHPSAEAVVQHAMAAAIREMPGGSQWQDGEGMLRKPVDWLQHLGLDYAIEADSEGNWARPMTLAEFRERYPVPPASTASDVVHVERNQAAMAQATHEHGTHPTASEILSTQGQEALAATVAGMKAELMKLDKAALQGEMKRAGGTDLAHNREWLACWIIARRLGENDAACVAYAKSKGTTPLGTAVTPENPVPTNVQPAFPGDLSFMLKAIEGAKSEGALLALRDNLVQRRGDQAWTDEMAEAARQKVLTFIAAENNAVSPESRALARVAQATEPQHIAALWHEVTQGGNNEAAWTDAIRQAADARMVEIRTAQGAPPANPYGGQG